MGGTHNLSRTVTQLDLTSINGQIAPYSIKFKLMLDFAATVAFWTPASVLVRLNEDQKLSLTFIELETANSELFQLQELSDKRIDSHRFLLCIEMWWSHQKKVEPMTSISSFQVILPRVPFAVHTVTQDKAFGLCITARTAEDHRPENK
jgi:hypothetical protein